MFLGANGQAYFPRKSIKERKDSLEAEEGV
jgi:hypothetical protein